MLQLPEDFDASAVNEQSFKVAKQYIIKPYDRISVEVFTNKGERIIDPDFELLKDIPAGQSSNKPSIEYNVNKSGEVKLPMVGKVQIADLTLRQAEKNLQDKYKAFYNDPFVNIEFLNNRVTVVGEVNKVVPLINENVHLIEVLALADAVTNNSKVQNIRLLRGEDVYLVDLSTLEGMKATNMIVQPGDIVYVEPVRRPFVESVRDYGPIISVVTSITAIIAILTK